MNKLLPSLLIAAYLLQIIPMQSTDRTGPLLVIAEDQVSLSAQGATFGDCLLVRTDGRVYFKHRIQAHPGAPVRIGAYEAALNPLQLAELKALLNDKEVTALRMPTEPHIPATISMRHDVEVEIWRTTGIQRTGYSDWKGHLPGNSREDAPPRIKQEQVQAEKRLKPLIDWSHKIETMKLTPTAIDGARCSQ